MIKQTSCALIWYNNTNDDRCATSGCDWTDPTVWKGGVVPGFNDTVNIANSTQEIYISIDIDTVVNNYKVSLWGDVNLFVNGSLNAYSVFLYGQSTLWINGNSTINFTNGADVIVTDGNFVSGYAVISELTMTNATGLFGSLAATETLVLENSVVTTTEYIDLAGFVCVGQNTINIEGSNVVGGQIMQVYQTDFTDPLSYLNVSLSATGMYGTPGLVIANLQTSLRAILNIQPQTTLMLGGPVTLYPFPNTSEIATIYGGGTLKTIVWPNISNLISPLGFGSNFILEAGGEINVPYIQSPTNLSAWQPSVIYSNVSSPITTGSELTIIGNVMTNNLTVSVGLASPSLTVNGSLSIEGNITVVEYVANVTWRDCHPNGQVNISLVTSSSPSIGGNFSNHIIYVANNNVSAALYSENNFVWNVTQRNGSLYLYYESSASDCHYIPPPGNKFPRWAIYAIAFGGAGVITLGIIVAVVISRRRRAGYEPVMTNNVNKS